MTIRNLLRYLESAGSGWPVRYSFCYCRPTTVGSWRGIYSEAALGWVDDSRYTRVSELIAELKGCIGKTYVGWKGGDYAYNLDTKIHVDNPGSCSYTEIQHVEIGDEEVVLHTVFRAE